MGTARARRLASSRSERSLSLFLSRERDPSHPLQNKFFVSLSKRGSLVLLLVCLSHTPSFLSSHSLGARVWHTSDHTDTPRIVFSTTRIRNGAGSCNEET